MQCRIVNSLDELVGQGTKFSLIYADPPWTFRNRRSHGAAANHYDVMTIEDILALPIAKLAAARAQLHLWAPNALLPEALEVIRAWGFAYKTNMVWVKHGPNGRPFGCGWYYRSAHELLLLGTRGTNVRFIDRSVCSWKMTNATDHSTKPDAIRELVEQNAPPGERLELFARRTVPGWHVFGDQVQKYLF